MSSDSMRPLDGRVENNRDFPNLWQGPLPQDLRKRLDNISGSRGLTHYANTAVASGTISIQEVEHFARFIETDPKGHSDAYHDFATELFQRRTGVAPTIQIPSYHLYTLAAQLGESWTEKIEDMNDGGGAEEPGKTVHLARCARWIRNEFRPDPASKTKIKLEAPDLDLHLSTNPFVTKPEEVYPAGYCVDAEHLGAQVRDADSPLRYTGIVLTWGDDPLLLLKTNQQHSAQAMRSAFHGDKRIVVRGGIYRIDGLLAGAIAGVLSKQLDLNGDLWRQTNTRKNWFTIDLQKLHALIGRDIALQYARQCFDPLLYEMDEAIVKNWKPPKPIPFEKHDGASFNEFSFIVEGVTHTIADRPRSSR